MIELDGDPTLPDETRFLHATLRGGIRHSESYGQSTTAPCAQRTAAQIPSSAKPERWRSHRGTCEGLEILDLGFVDQLLVQVR